MPCARNPTWKDYTQYVNRGQMLESNVLRIAVCSTISYQISFFETLICFGGIKLEKNSFLEVLSLVPILGDFVFYQFPSVKYLPEFLTDHSSRTPQWASWNWYRFIFIFFLSFWWDLRREERKVVCSVSHLDSELITFYHGRHRGTELMPQIL